MEIRLNIYNVNPRISSLLPVMLLATLFASPSFGAPKADAKVEEIQVTLFGQPCVMNGPFPRASLSQLHEISPEKLPPDLSLDQMKKIRARANDLKGMPLSVEQYRDHLRKRLSAKIAFNEAIGPAKKAKPDESKKTLETFLKNIKEHISTLQYPAFEEAAKKALEGAGSTWSDAFVTTLRERFETVIQPDTEEEFHRAIRIAKIQYVCVFDDADHHAHDEDYEGEE